MISTCLYPERLLTLFLWLQLLSTITKIPFPFPNVLFALLSFFFYPSSIFSFPPNFPKLIPVIEQFFLHSFLYLLPFFFVCRSSHKLQCPCLRMSHSTCAGPQASMQNLTCLTPSLNLPICCSEPPIQLQMPRRPTKSFFPLLLITLLCFVLIVYINYNHCNHCNHICHIQHVYFNTLCCFR